MPYDPVLVKDLMGVGFSPFQAVKLGIMAASELTAGSSPTTGFAAGDFLTSGGTNLSKLTPGTGVATALGNTAGSTGSFALQNDARLTGLAGPVTKNADWTFVATDIGNLYRCTDTGTHAWTIDTFANAPIAAAQTITGTNESTATLTVVAPSGGSLIRLDGAAGTGTRTIGANSMFTLVKLDGADAWGISGTALS